MFIRTFVYVSPNREVSYFYNSKSAAYNSRHFVPCFVYFYLFFAHMQTINIGYIRRDSYVDFVL